MSNVNFGRFNAYNTEDDSDNFTRKAYNKTNGEGVRASVYVGWYTQLRSALKSSGRIYLGSAPDRGVGHAVVTVLGCNQT